MMQPLPLELQTPWHQAAQQQWGTALFIAGFGLVLGMRHSTDADHVVAISTIVTRQRNIRGAALIGILWGLGHAVTIFFVGCLIILWGVVIPARVGLSMEFSVALMLILLGVLNLTGTMAKLAARFAPSHVHSASLDQAPGRDGFSFRRLLQQKRAVRSEPARAALRHALTSTGISNLLRPLAIGLVHGLAGSAAIALLVLSTIHTPLYAAFYLVIFGVGTMLGMICMTAAMALPLIYAGDRVPQVSRFLGVASGVVSVCFGMFLVYQLGYVGGLFTSHPHWMPQ